MSPLQSARYNSNYSTNIGKRGCTAETHLAATSFVPALNLQAVNNIVPTLAFQLSQSYPAYRSALCKVLKEEPQASKLDVRWQFQKLIEGPIRAVKDSAVLEDTVIVIDALDERDDGQTFRLFLETLLKLVPDLPFKIFLTS